MRKISVNCPTSNLEEYRRLAELACELGASQLSVSQIEPSMWQWDANRYDPYPNWGINSPTIFKFIVPDELKGYLPEDYAKRNLDMLAKRAEILKEFGLKATFNGTEPAYLPEKVYRDHPEWRGARCDQARRARTEYYAPCLDNPELRAIYVDSVEKICRIAPIEAFTLLSNDSGGGLCWAEGLYPGKNGPLACAHIPIGKRIARYLSIFQEGAARAGITATAGVTHIDERDVIASLPDLLPGQTINNRTATSNAVARIVGFAVDYTDHATPVALMPRFVTYTEQMQAVQEDPDCDIKYLFRSINDELSIRYVKEYSGKIGRGPAGRYNAIADFARKIAGEKQGDDLAEVWNLIEKSISLFEYLQTGGHIFHLGTVHQRWLTRPLVAFPAELKPEEKNYYREYQFQAQSEADADNMCDLQANCWLSGYGAANLLIKTVNNAMPFINKAIDLTGKLLSGADDESKKALFEQTLLKLRLYRCIVRNARNVVEFQNILDRTDYSVTPVDVSPCIREQGDIRYFKVNEILRNEVDNTLEIISIIKKDPSVFRTTEVKFKSVVCYGDDIIDDLKKKITIMEDHRRDFERLYKSYNR